MDWQLGRQHYLMQLNVCWKRFVPAGRIVMLGDGSRFSILPDTPESLFAALSVQCILFLRQCMQAMEW